MLSLLTLLLAPTPAALPLDPPVIMRMDDRDDDDHGHKGHGDKAWKHERKEQEKEWRQWSKHHHDEDEGDDRDWDFDHPRHTHLPPALDEPLVGRPPGPPLCGRGAQ